VRRSVNPVLRRVTLRWVFALLAAACGAGAQIAPVPLADLNHQRPPGWTVYDRSAPYGFQRLGERVVFASSVRDGEGACLLWS